MMSGVAVEPIIFRSERMIDYVCRVCGDAHRGIRPPKKCRCGSTQFEERIPHTRFSSPRKF